MVGDRSAEEREREERQRLGEGDGTEGQRRPVTELEDQERLRDDLHPGADRRADEAEPQEPEVPVPKHMERSASSRLERPGRPRTSVSGVVRCPRRHGLVWFFPRFP